MAFISEAALEARRRAFDRSLDRMVGGFKTIADDARRKEAAEAEEAKEARQRALQDKRDTVNLAVKMKDQGSIAKAAKLLGTEDTVIPQFRAFQEQQAADMEEELMEDLSGDPEIDAGATTMLLGGTPQDARATREQIRANLPSEYTEPLILGDSKTGSSNKLQKIRTAQQLIKSGTPVGVALETVGLGPKDVPPTFGEGIATDKELKRVAKQEETARKQRKSDEDQVRTVQLTMSGNKRGGKLIARTLVRNQLARNALRLIEKAKIGEIKTTKQFARELSTVMASTLSSGNVAAQSQIEELTPHSLQGEINDRIQFLKGTTQDTVPEDFLDQFEEQLHQEKEFFSEELDDQAAQMAILLEPIFNRRNKDGELVNQDLRDNFIASLRVFKRSKGKGPDDKGAKIPGVDTKTSKDPSPDLSEEEFLKLSEDDREKYLKARGL